MAETDPVKCDLTGEINSHSMKYDERKRGHEPKQGIEKGKVSGYPMTAVFTLAE